MTESYENQNEQSNWTEPDKNQSEQPTWEQNPKYYYTPPKIKTLYLYSQQCLIKLVEGNIDLHNVEILFFDVILNNEIKAAASGKRVSSSSNQIIRLFHIQFQGKRKCDCCGLGGLITGVITDLGEVLLGNICLLIDLRVLLAGLVNQLKQRLRKSSIRLI